MRWDGGAWRRRPRRPPGPGGLAGAAATLAFFRDPLAFLSGPVSRARVAFRLPVGREALIFLRDPELAGEVLADRSGSFQKDSITRTLKSLVGTGLLTAEGERWRRQRQTHRASFTPTATRDYAETMAAAAESLFDDYRGGEVRDVHADMLRLTLDILVRTIFGTAAADEGRRLAGPMSDVVTSFQQLMQTWRRLTPRWWPLAARRRLAAARRVLDETFVDIVARKRRADHAHTADLLSALLSAACPAGADARAGLDPVRDQAVTLLLAGHETTASSLAFTFFLLARHPSWARAATDEVRGVVGKRRVAIDDLARLPLCEAIWLESLRLLPPAWVMGREALEDCRVGPFAIARGEEAVIPIWCFHRDARWFADPSAFVPSRWTDGLRERLPSHVFLPFGGGGRRCVAAHFARQEVLIVLATALTRLSFSVPEGAGPAPALLPSITLRPRAGVHLRVRS